MITRSVILHNEKYGKQPLAVFKRF